MGPVPLTAVAIATWRSSCTSNSRPSAASIARVRALPTSSTLSVAYQTVTPRPICAGVFGMQRTTAGWSRPSPSAVVVAPAMMLITS